MTLNNPQDSVCDYLAELLYEGTEDAGVDVPEPAVAAPKLEPKPTIAAVTAVPVVSTELDKERLNRLLSSAQSARETLPLTEPVAVEKEVTKSKAPAVATQAEEAPGTAPAITDPLLQWHPNGRPQWAQDRFDVLLFKVYGLTLAVPLIALGQIQPLDDQLTPLFGQADWFMGIQPTPMGKIKTVNTALFVMPERYNPAFLDSAKYVISIHGVPWGLAVDSVEQPKSLSPDDVKWRSGRTQRPWLAGTVKEHMCALIDIPKMADLLKAADHNTAPS